MLQHTKLALSLAFLFVFVGGAGAQVLVPNTSTWRWLHSIEGVDPAEAVKDFHTTFFQMDFDDSSWKRGTDKPGPHGGFGYGDAEFEGTNIGQPEDLMDRKTAYFRLKFTTDAAYENLVFKCQRDDGIIVYLDGTEVLRDNIPRGTFGLRKLKDVHDLFADQIISGEDETKVNSFPLAIKLPAGEHVFAISLHNRAQRSSDLRIAEISLSVQSEDDDSEKDEEKEDKDE